MAKQAQFRARPTLWRTCRVLANRTRLTILRSVMRRPGRCVADVSKDLRIPESLASQYLRALSARGLLEAHRVSRWVRYHPNPDETVPEARRVLEALECTFSAEKKPIDMIFRLATAFTHPRRQEIFRALHSRPMALAELKAKTGISKDALRRHLDKLVARGFVIEDAGGYRRSVPGGALAETLSKLAVTSRG